MVGRWVGRAGGTFSRTMHVVMGHGRGNMYIHVCNDINVYTYTSQPPETLVGRAGDEMQSSLWDEGLSRAGGRDIKCNLHSVMGHGGGKK